MPSLILALVMLQSPAPAPPPPASPPSSAPTAPSPGGDESATESDFVNLFDGTTLKGWTGDTIGWVVESGAIACGPKGGNLLTEGVYSNFELRFEFQLTEGANNGLAIRAPKTGDAAYVGMELQVLDDSSTKYASLKPWQYHGSIYGVVPSKRGSLRPVGEWNQQTVIAKGPRIQVILNGTVIVDADITAAAQDGAVDGKPHPGLRRQSGHIGFLGHGDRVLFRNIRVKELH
jgi:hypothetical protein